MVNYKYNRSELLKLKNSCQSQPQPLSASTWKTLCELQISLRGLTLRGFREAALKQGELIQWLATGQQLLLSPVIKREKLTIIPTSSTACAPSETVNFCLYNTRSIRNKGGDLVDFVSDNDLDIIALTETWLTSSDTVGCWNMTPKGYILYHQARPKDKKGGSVGLLCKSGNVQSLWSTELLSPSVHSLPVERRLFLSLWSIIHPQHLSVVFLPNLHPC